MTNVLQQVVNMNYTEMFYSNLIKKRKKNIPENLMNKGDSSKHFPKLLIQLFRNPIFKCVEYIINIYGSFIKLKSFRI